MDCGKLRPRTKGKPDRNVHGLLFGTAFRCVSAPFDRDSSFPGRADGAVVLQRTRHHSSAIRRVFGHEEEPGARGRIGRQLGHQSGLAAASATMQQVEALESLGHAVGGPK